MLEILICGLEIVWLATLLALVALVAVDVLSAVNPDRDQDKANKRMRNVVFTFVASVVSKVASWIA